MMPRQRRNTPGGWVYHVLNRGVGRRRLFYKPADYEAFEEILEDTLMTRPMRICGYCLMPNHWHLVVWPERDGDLAAFMQRLTVTHVTRWQRHRRRVGEGHLYQGRFKSFPVQGDEHFYQVMRYVERNALRAGLCEEAENWRYGSLWRRCSGSAEERSLLGGWPVGVPRDWRRLVNQPMHETELDAIRESIHRGRPYGSVSWTAETASKLGLGHTLRSRGRPATIPEESTSATEGDT